MPNRVTTVAKPLHVERIVIILVMAFRATCPLTTLASRRASDRPFFQSVLDDAVRKVANFDDERCTRSVSSRVTRLFEERMLP